MPLTRSDMQFLKDLVKEKTGVIIDNDKYQLVQSRLSRIVYLNKLASLGQLMTMLYRRPKLELRQQVIEALLTNETQFFREPQVFDLVKQLILENSCQDYHIWSAACSTGQEPYSLAMMLSESEQLKHKTISILASDISRKAINMAETGVYSEFEISRGLKLNQRRQHFCPHPAGWKINPEVRNRVTFKTINLYDKWPLMPQMNMILLRNVLIYFSHEGRLKLLARIAAQLKPTGYLIVGTGESTDTIHDAFEWIKIGKHSVYRRLTCESAKRSQPWSV